MSTLYFSPLKSVQGWIFGIFSFLIVAFGQPAWSPVLGVLTAAAGLALFWRVLIEVESGKRRFWIATAWFAGVQAVQLSWLLTHPYAYIYGVYLFLILSISMLFGFFVWLLTPARISKVLPLLGLAGFYTLLEWGRLFFLSGFSFNPLGLTLSSSIWGLQVASLAGIYGMTFWVIFTNLLLLKAWLFSHKKTLLIWAMVVLAPYLFGAIHLAYHRPGIVQADLNPKTQLKALLVQTAFPTEETMPFKSFEEAVRYTEEEWAEIFKILAKHREDKTELIALPEYVVPYGTYVSIYPYATIEKLFKEQFGEQSIQAFPHLQAPLAVQAETKEWRVSNAFISQALANLFQADLVVGLQDDQWVSEEELQSFSSAFHFWPGGEMGLRYDKQVLLPMGEYIPFEFCRAYAKDYGITGSFTCGAGAKVFPGCKVPFGLSVCYEETYGHLMRENRVKGAELLINLTSDVWYPNSRLPKQHFDHARLRSVEMGIPLIRACNTGITAAFDSLGQIVGSLGEEAEWERTALSVKVPLYHYRTLYAITGDWLIIGFACLFALGLFMPKRYM